MAVSGIYLVLALTPPVLYHIHSPYTADVRAVVGAICHQRPSRCLWFFDFPCGLCAKCLGFYVGIFLSAIWILASNKVLNLVAASVFSAFIVIVLLDSILGFMLYSLQYIMFVNFVLSILGAVGIFNFFLNRLCWGGKLMRIVVKGSVFLIAVVVLFNLYGFSRAYGDTTTSSDATKTSVIIPAGTGVILSVIGDISTKNYREGDTVPLQVTTPIKVKDILVIRGGTPARGILAMARSASSWGGAGELVLEAKSVQAIDGTEIPITGTTSRRGDTSHGASAAVAVGTGVLCLPLALTGAAVKGEEGRVMPGFELVARTLNDQTIQILSEAEQQNIQKQQELLAKQQRANAEARAQKLKEEEDKKKKSNPSTSHD